MVTEFPYQTSVEVIEQKISDLVRAGELDGISEVLNASANQQPRLVIELKRDANANVVLNNLFKQTPLQTSFGVNMLALVDSVPRTLNLAQALSHYIDHQIEVITRRSEFRLRKAQERAHIVEGLLRAIDMLDAVIATIRGSDDRPSARTALMAEPFSFSEIQATHILDMTLGRLTRLGRTELQEEMAKLLETIAELRGDPGRRHQAARRDRHRDDGDPGQVRQPAPQHHHPRPRRDGGRGPDRRRGDRRHHDQGRLHQVGGRRRLPHPGPGWPGRPGGPAEGRGPGQPGRALLRALLPACCSPTTARSTACAATRSR